MIGVPLEFEGQEEIVQLESILRHEDKFLRSGGSSIQSGGGIVIHLASRDEGEEEGAGGGGEVNFSRRRGARRRDGEGKASAVTLCDEGTVPASRPLSHFLISNVNQPHPMAGFLRRVLGHFGLLKDVNRHAEQNAETPTSAPFIAKRVVKGRGLAPVVSECTPGAGGVQA
ncbi:hypothetical protein L7F22_023872 [Adiantum nelumboides]|nr:hypothetical protein [Adiantum nelumboides]